MNDFTASNGIRINVADDASGTYLLGVMPTLDQTHATGSVDGIQALREFFQAEADERLGRWRHGDFIVYDRGDYVQVIHEPDGASGMLGSWTRAEVSGDCVTGSGFRDAARAYFDAHPEPKPWHDAAAGEVWLLTIDREADVPSVASSSEGGHVVFTAATGGAGGTEEIAPESNYITAGRRIFPEVS